MVAIAGSIGIIGIALILGLSNGVSQFIKDTEEKNYDFLSNRKLIAVVFPLEKHLKIRETKGLMEIFPKYKLFKRCYQQLIKTT